MALLIAHEKVRRESQEEAEKERRFDEQLAAYKALKAQQHGAPQP